MQISVSDNLVNFVPVEVGKLEDLTKLLAKKNWSTAVFRDNYRKKDNFIQTQCIALDFDGDEDAQMTLDEAREAFAPFKHLLMTTKSHRKEKNGKVADRFRALVFLSEPIKDEATYYATWYYLQSLFPAIDPACKDPSRFFYPSKKVVGSNMQGKLIEPVSPEEEKAKQIDRDQRDPEQVAHDGEMADVVADLQQGELSRRTLRFMHRGSRPGQTHRELYQACRDYLQNKYSEEQFIADLTAMIERTGNWPHKKLTKKDLDTISDAFKKAAKHDPRFSYEPALLFEPVGDILSNEETFEWMVQGLLSVGGCSIIAGSAKKGKSTITRQLAKAVARGEKFLNRKTKQGTVFIAALEEQKSLLKEQLKRAGITAQDPIKMHVGTTLSGDVIDTLEDVLAAEDVRLLIIDTFQLGLKIKELQNYVEVYAAITPFRDLARATGTHILFLHHSNKMGMGSNMVSGSKAITGSMDTVMLFQDIGKKRFLTTEGRGIDPWYQLELKYISKTETYLPGTEGGMNEDDSF